MKKKAQIVIKDAIVQVSCPYCGAMQPSPSYPNSYGWDANDTKRYGLRGEVACDKCGARFQLPLKVLHLMSGAL